MKDAHLSLEILARCLANDLSHEEMVEAVLGHLLACCESCRRKYEEIQRLKDQVGHWDERVVLFESQQAPELLERLLTLPFEEQLELVQEDESYQIWGFCHLLLQQSFEAVFVDPARAVNLTELAVKITQTLDDAYDPHWVTDLKARAHAYLGNARRVLGELRSAETAFREADEFLAESMTGNLQIEAEILNLKASLRRDQRQFEEAVELLDRAVGIYEQENEPHKVGRSLVKKAKVLEEKGDLATAIELLPGALDLIDVEQDPRLAVYGRHNLILCLTTAERHEEAKRLLPEIRTLFERIAKPLDLVRLRWTEGRIAAGLGDLAEAECAFREVQREFFARGMGYDTALVSLDLAILFARQGRTGEIKQLAAEILPVFESRDVHREAMATLIMFQHAAEEERLTVSLAQHLAFLLKRERPSRS